VSHLSPFYVHRVTLSYLLRVFFDLTPCSFAHVPNAASWFEVRTLKTEVTNSFTNFARRLARQHEFKTLNTVAFLLPSWYWIWLVLHVLNRTPNWKSPLPPTRLPIPLVILCCPWIVHKRIDISKCNLQNVPRALSVILYSILLNKILI